MLTSIEFRFILEVEYYYKENVRKMQGIVILFSPNVGLFNICYGFFRTYALAALLYIFSVLRLIQILLS